MPCDAQKSNHQKDREQEGGVELCSRIFELVIQNIFVNGKYCVCNSKLLPLEEKSNVREAYFNKAELARTVFPLLQGLGKMLLGLIVATIVLQILCKLTDE